MKKGIKFTLMSMILTFILIINSFTVSAASFSVSKSKSSVSPGGTFTVTITCSSGAGQFSISAKNGTVSNNSLWIDNGSGSVTVTAGNSGTVTVSVTATDVTANDESAITGSKTVSVTIKQASSTNNSGSNSNSTTNNNSGNNSSSNSNSVNNNTTTITKSSDNTLKSLAVSRGTLSPSFSSSKTKYNIDLAGDVTEVTINATANDSKASVRGTGKKELKVGNNEFKVVCTAENGTKKTYTLVFYVDETPLVYTKYNDLDLGVVRILDDVKIPEGFEKNTIELDEQKITGYSNKNLKLDIAYLIDENGNKAFYIIEKGKVKSLYQTIKVNGNTYVIIPSESSLEQIKNLKETSILIDDKELSGWIFDDDNLKNYTLIYLMNSKGETHLYSYESSEGTLQIYTEPADRQPVEITYILAGTSGLFALTTLFFAIKYFRFKKKKVNEIKNFYEKRNIIEE